MVRCGVTAVGVLFRNPPGMVTVSEWKCPVFRFLMRGVRWGQRTGRWLVKTCRKL